MAHYGKLFAWIGTCNNDMCGCVLFPDTILGMVHVDVNLNLNYCKYVIYMSKYMSRFDAGEV